MRSDNLLKYIILTSSIFIMLGSINSVHHFINVNTSFAQTNTSPNSNNSNNTIANMTALHPWISKKNNLNITMKIEPRTPIVDQDTKLTFDVEKLNNDVPANFAKTVKVTMVNSDGEIFKFTKQNITNNTFTVTYKFPNVGVDRAIIQLYKNTVPFDIGAFDINVPNPPQSNVFSNLFKGL